MLEDEMAITVLDDAYGEERWVTLGIDGLARVLAVVYTWRGTQKEQHQYLENG